MVLYLAIYFLKLAGSDIIMKALRENYSDPAWIYEAP
jgi:hypothetical protein